MRRYNLMVFLTLMTVAAQAQFINNGATVTIQSGATLRVETNIENNGTGTINIVNGGTLEVMGNFTQANTASLTPNQGTVKFIGNGNSDVNIGTGTPNNVFTNVVMAKTGVGGKVTLTAPLSISGNLSFTGTDNNKIFLNNFDLTVGSASVVSATTNHSTNGYVVTGSTGRLVRTNLGTTEFTFPVGFNETTYNPITIAENGTIDNIGVRVLERAYENGVSGTAITSEVVDASWVISEANVGSSNLTVTPQWLTADEMPSFTRADCGVSKYIGPNYDLLLAGMGGASGMGTAGDLYKRVRSGVTPGTFVVGDDKVMDYVAVSPKVFLGGPTPVSGEMPDNLRTLNLIPTAEPYTSLAGFTHVGRGGGESVSSNVVFNQVTGNGTQDDIVDWGFVELRSPANTVISTKSVLIQRDGDIVETDMSSVKFRGHIAGNYSFAFRHRNHLGIATSSAIALTSTPTTLNFTDGSSSTIGTNAQRIISGVRMLWPGNALVDGFVRFSGSNNDADVIKNNIISQPGNPFGSLTFSYSAYNVRDLNLDGTIRFSGTNNDKDIIKNNVIAHPANPFGSLTYTINQQF